MKAINLVLTACLLFVTSCRWAPTDALPPASTLLAESEAEHISGFPSRLAFDIRDEWGPRCAYVAQTQDGIYSVGLDTQLIGDGQTANHAAGHRAVAEKYGSVEDIGGLGDVAFLSIIERPYNTPSRGYMLYVRSGSIGIQLRADSQRPEGEVRETLFAQAERILARCRAS